MWRKPSKVLTCLIFYKGCIGILWYAAETSDLWSALFRENGSEHGTEVLQAVKVNRAIFFGNKTVKCVFPRTMISDKTKVGRVRFRYYANRHAIHSQQKVRAKSHRDAAGLNFEITLIESKLEIDTIEVPVRVIPHDRGILTEMCKGPEAFMESMAHRLNKQFVRVRLK